MATSRSKLGGSWGERKGERDARSVNMVNRQSLCSLRATDGINIAGTDTQAAVCVPLRGCQLLFH